MTTTKKRIRKYMVVLLAVLFIAAFAAGCSPATEEEGHPFIEMMSEIKQLHTGSVSILKAGELYTIPTTKYETLLSLLHSVKAEQCSSVSELRTGSNYELRLHGDALGEVWIFQCFAEEENSVYVFYLEQDWGDYYNKYGTYPPFPEMDGSWLKIQSSGLYRFIAGTMDAFFSGNAADENVPEVVSEKAGEIMRQQLDETIAEFADDKNSWEFETVLTGLSQLNTGTAGLDFSVDVYQLDYVIEGFCRTESSQEYKTTNETNYLIFLYPDTIHGSDPVFLDSLNLFELVEKYGTPEMLENYGDMYVAAAMELYHGWKETNGLADAEPARPDGAFSKLAQDGEDILVTLYSAGAGASRTVSVEHGSYTYGQVKEIFANGVWVEMEMSRVEAGVNWDTAIKPDYWLTITSEDGSRSVTLWGGTDLVQFSADGKEIYWQPAPGETTDHGAALKYLYQCEENNSAQIIVQADNGYEAAEAFVAAFEEHYLNRSPGHQHTILDYDLLGWGVNEIDVDDTRVIGWIKYAILPAGEYNNFLAGGIWFGEGKYENWLVDSPGFSLVKQGDGTWRCTGTGGGFISMEYAGYTLAPAYAEGWDYYEGDWRLQGDAGLPYEEYFARLVDYGYDWYADHNSGVKLDVMTGGNISPYAVEQEGDVLHLYKWVNLDKQYVRPLMTIPGVKLLNYDKNWMYCLVGETDLVRVSYGGGWATLFSDQTGLISRIEQRFAVGGKRVIYFMAGMPEGGAAIYRLCLLSTQADVMYCFTEEELEALRFTSYDLYSGEAEDDYQIGGFWPISNYEFYWSQSNRDFHELAGKILADPEQYADYYHPDHEFMLDLFAISRDYGLCQSSVHYYNGLTGMYSRQDRLGYSEGAPTRWWLEENDVPSVLKLSISDMQAIINGIFVGES